MKWIAVEVEGNILRLWPEGGDEIRRTLEAGVTLASLIPEIEHTVSITADTQILASGMCHELCSGAVMPVPCRPPKARHLVPKTMQIDPRVALVPPVMQDHPTGVMHHEVSRIAGLIAKDPNFDGVACLVGTNTVWAHISAEEIVSFQSASTGQMMHALCGGCLRVGDGFDDALSDMMSRPQALSARLASLQAALDLGRLGEDDLTAQMSGLLVGAELAAMRPYWLGQRVAVIGEADAIAPYQHGLTAQGVMVEPMSGASLALAGLATSRADG